MHFEAYIDESGNTGIDLFDKRQPFFWTGTMVVRQGILFPCDIASIAQKVGKKSFMGVNWDLGV